MGCCSGDPADVEATEIGKTRKCTDKFWLFLFGVCWIVLSVAAVWSFMEGNPGRLIHGYDSFGNICGQKNKQIKGVSWSGLNMRENPYVFHMNPSDTSKTLKICVKACADKNLTNDGDLLLFYQRTGSSLYRYDHDPKETNPSSFYNGFPGMEIVTRRQKDEMNGYGPGPKMPVIKQRPLLNRCVGTERIKLGNSIINNVYAYLKNLDIAQKVTSDIYASFRNIAYTVLFGIGISLLVTFTIHYMASIVSGLIMVVCSVTLVVLTGFLWYVYFDLKYKLNQIPSIEQLDDDLVNEKTFLAISILVTVITLIILLVMYFMKNRLALMVALFDETASCLRSMPALIAQPIWTCSALLIFLFFWSTVFLAISTAERDIIYDANTTRFNLNLPARSIVSLNHGTPMFSTKADLYKIESVKHEQPPVVKYLWWFMILMLFWSSEFILGCQQMTVASSVASWYFSRDRSSLSCPIGNSIQRVTKYHLGSIALGSFLIILLKIPRMILAYIDYYLKQYKDKYACVSCTLKCCHCFLYCLENFIRYINHNAYTIIAIKGTDYCSSAQAAFITLSSNTMRILAINTMGDFIIFLGKVLVTSGSASFGVYLMKDDPAVHYLFVPVLFSAIITYLVAHSMLCVYEMVIDTMFICFVEDVKSNASSPEGFYAPEGLLKFAQEDGAEMKPGTLTITSELNATNQPQNGKRDDPNQLPKIGFVYPNLIQTSSH